MKLVLPALLLFTCAVQAENWAQWRGPAFNGASTETGLPTTFSKTENMKWSIPLSGGSAATPIIWEDHIFVTANDKRTGELQAVCINRKDGKVLWQKGIGQGSVNSASPTGKNTYAAPSAVTDGKLVWFTFGNGDLGCFDFTGKQIWAKSLSKEYGQLTYMHGFSSSPLLYDGKLIFPVLRRDRAEGKNAAAGAADAVLDSFLLCLDGATGKELWKQLRKPGGKNGAQEGYTSPVPFAGSHKEIVLTGADAVTGHDPATGSELWRWTGFVNPGDSRTVSSALVLEDRVVAGGSQPNPTVCIKLGGKGPDDLLWKYAESPNNVSTPLAYNGLVYLADHKKRAVSCINPKTGEKKGLSILDTKDELHGSPTGADGKVYVMDCASKVFVFEAGPELKLLHKVDLEDGRFSSASIAVAQKQLFVRTATALYCFGK